jgi:hypothetical protein
MLNRDGDQEHVSCKEKPYTIKEKSQQWNMKSMILNSLH